VPQKDYRSKQWSSKRLNPVSFSVNGRPGVNMGDALRKTFVGLDGQDDPVLTDATGAISCRLLVGLLRFFHQTADLTAGADHISSSPVIRPTAAHVRYFC
jgi:hypothetical protein